ncbi:MAG: Asp-tRNA(Asn)/Glu-tRNA(Gln) amidotransferase subunit GatB, partial [Candidatus Peregrinibacteria bacterium]|nr:Asp-tRNA(Asn)/Glu-tRNA(Gln) amidotransferase subunit GatB [Candidatus Peregrinibacteria bacterium]
SQYDFPLSSKGSVTYDIIDSSGKVSDTKTCGITRLHMENDAGKLTHRGSTTLCDYNRAGTPLMEIVTEPDLRSAKEAVAFAQELRRILIAVGSSEADMFKGMMRFDASISLREKGTDTLNPRSEIKNLNSFKALEKALQYEEKRLRGLWDDTGGPLKGDITVGWLDDQEKTKMLREKETADDYRYFPEPDIPPLRFTASDIDALKNNMPALPRELKEKYLKMGVSDAEALMLVDDSYYQKLFEAVLDKTDDVKRARSLVLTQIAGFKKKEEKEYGPVESVERMIELLNSLIDKTNSGAIHKNQEKGILQEMIECDYDVDQAIHVLDIKPPLEDNAINDYVLSAIQANPKAVEDYKSGNEKALAAVIGYVMKESKGQADPAKVNEILRKELS